MIHQDIGYYGYIDSFLVATDATHDYPSIYNKDWCTWPSIISM